MQHLPAPPGLVILNPMYRRQYKNVQKTFGALVIRRNNLAFLDAFFDNNGQARRRRMASSQRLATDKDLMITTLKRLVDHRELMATLAWKRIAVRHKQAYLGIAWYVTKVGHLCALMNPMPRAQHSDHDD